MAIPKRIKFRLSRIGENNLAGLTNHRKLVDSQNDRTTTISSPSRRIIEWFEAADEQTCLVEDTTRDPRLPPAGTLLSKTYKGQVLTVLVRQDDFEFNGEVYATLSAIANAVTGSHINGFSFFKLKRKKEVAQ